MVTVTIITLAASSVFWGESLYKLIKKYNQNSRERRSEGKISRRYRSLYNPFRDTIL